MRWPDLTPRRRSAAPAGRRPGQRSPDAAGGGPRGGKPRSATSYSLRDNDPVGRLEAVLRGKRSLLIVMQDNPDPDSIAGAAALRRLANALTGISCSIGYGGVIGRSENRALMDYLNLNFRSWDEIRLDRYDAIALVDTQPRTGNNALPSDVRPTIVLDHHPLRDDTRTAEHVDVRPRYGAVSSILFEYLTQAGITPDPPLATALLYAIRSDTQDLGIEACRADVEAATVLFPLANSRMLSVIQRGSVDDVYFRTLYRALDSARTHGRRLFASLDRITSPDLTGEMADLFLRHERVDWVLCCGFHEGQAWLSLRTSQSERKADEVIGRVVEGIGTGGGHAMSAGGQVSLPSSSGEARRDLAREILGRFLRHTGGRCAGRRLVPARSGS